MKNLTIIAFASAVVCSSSVTDASQPIQPTPSDQFNNVLIQQMGSASLAAPLQNPDNNPHVREFGATISGTKWPNSTVYVCWENPDSSNLDARQWTREAVAVTWEKYSSLVFKGWEKCADSNAGIRIKIEDLGPHVKSIGKRLDRVPEGMVLNATFKNWGTDCQKTLEYCIKTIAVHEFGHAIGFTHEQNRPDVPGECTDPAQGADPDMLLTPYDKNSVMNYCNKAWSNDGILSELDIQAVQLLYGKK